MSSGYQRTLELLRQLIASKKNLSDTLVSKGEEAEFSEPFDDLVQKAADYIPKSYIFVDDNGNEIAGALVSQETVFDADVNDVREGKTFASELGVKTGEKVIPSYQTTNSLRAIKAGEEFTIPLVKNDLYAYTKFQAMICPYNGSLSNSLAVEKAVQNDSVYPVQSTEAISSVTKNDEEKAIYLGIKNETDVPYIIRYFTYKEIY